MTDGWVEHRGRRVAYATYGSDDTVHSPDLGATLAGRIAEATRTVVDGVGGSLLWARADVVLGALAS